ncbi:MAG: DUF1565 domain-containing protein [Chitinivibrionales bacterium]|nr:DUF1565 domain-containing protein [Chitinivibrionales bacterium]
MAVTLRPRGVQAACRCSLHARRKDHTVNTPIAALCFLCACLAFPGLAATYHVAPGGSDASDGSESSPFATLQKAADAAGTGDVVSIAAGTYQKVYANNEGVTFRARERHGVVVDGNGGADPLFDGAGDITIVGFVFTGRTGDIMTGMVRARTGWTFEDCRFESSRGKSEGLAFSDPVWGGKSGARYHGQALHLSKQCG